jgi:hypothetical protein
VLVDTSCRRRFFTDRHARYSASWRLSQGSEVRRIWRPIRTSPNLHFVNRLQTTPLAVGRLASWPSEQRWFTTLCHKRDRHP